MADKLDMLIGDYLTGRLKAKINAREIMLKYPPKVDNLGIHSQSSGIAPQEAQYLRIEGDKELEKLNRQKEILDIFWKVENKESKRVLVLYHCKHMTWEGVALEVHVGVVTLWRWNKNFKSMIFPFISPYL